MLSKGRRVDFRKYLPCLFFGIIFSFIGCLNHNAHAAVPTPWVNQGIGGQVAGSADFANNQFTLNSAGIDIGGSFDTFHYIYQPYTGDVELIAKVESIGNTNNLAKAGVMIRETLTTGSKNVFMALTYGSTSLFQRRTSTNGGTSTTSGTSVRAPYWVKLTRQGNTFKAYQSPDGVVWTQVGSSVSITMAANVYVGLAATSKDLTRLNTNVFSNVSVRPATPPVAPVLNTATGGVAQVDFSWNASATATSYKVEYGTVSGSYTTTLTLGNVTSTSVSGLNNGTVYYFVVTAVNDYGESAVSNQLSATPLDSPTVFIKKIDYNAMGQKTRIEYGNGVITTNTYDPLNLRLKRIYSVNASAQVLQDLSYTYDSTGNILSITDTLNTASQTFQYDALNRLTQANGMSYGVKNYEYDPIGNIHQKDGKIYSYAEGGAGVHAVTSLSDGTTMTYDANGNMATKQKGTEITYFDYDIENRLIQIQKDLVTVPKASAKITAKYEYDGDGGRVKKTVGSNVTRYVGSLFEETNGVRTRHIFVGDLKVASVTGAQQMYYLTDHLGSTNVLTDKVGVKKEVMEYEPYGTFARHDKYGTGAEVANFYFTGQKFDEESGLYYYNARYYDPSLGRFITADEVVSQAGYPITMNRYAYTGNNPIMNIDPSGHFFGLIFAAIKAIVSLAIAHPIIAGAIVGGISGGVAAGNNGGNLFQGIAFGAIQGGMAGMTLGLSPGTAGVGTGLNILKASAAASLTSQVADAADQDGLAQGLRYASMGLSAVYVGLNVGIGIKDWASSKLSVSDLAGNPASIQSNDNVFVNGMLTEKQGALNKAAELNALKNAGITKVAHNSTNGFIADMTESFLQKITFTSSVDRQLANMVKGLNNIIFTGHSQGTLITGNALLNLGFSDNRNVVTNSLNFSTPLSQPRAAISAAIGGTGNNRFIYANNWGDPINVIGPNINPPKFLSGFGMQIQNH